jgi:hypothetical protein
MPQSAAMYNEIEELIQAHKDRLLAKDPSVYWVIVKIENIVTKQVADMLAGHGGLGVFNLVMTSQAKYHPDSFILLNYHTSQGLVSFTYVGFLHPDETAFTVQNKGNGVFDVETEADVELE